MGGSDSVSTQIALLNEKMSALTTTVANFERKMDKNAQHDEDRREDISTKLIDMQKTLVTLSLNAEKISRIEDKLTETRKVMYDHIEKDETPADYITKKMGAATFAVIIALGSVIFNNLAQVLLNAFR